MKPVTPVDREQFFSNPTGTVGVLAVHNKDQDEPIGHYSVDLLIEWLEAIKQFEDTVYLWAIEHPGTGENHSVAASPPTHNPDVAYVVAGRTDI